MKHQPVTDDHLKKYAPIWKRHISFSNPDWTPMKLSVAIILSITLIVFALAFFPRQTTRHFAAPALTTTPLQFSNVKLRAYKGLKLSIRTLNRWEGRAYSKDGGISIKGNLTNSNQNEIFLMVRPWASITPADLNGSETIADNSEWRPLSMEVKGSAYATNSNKKHGYFIAPGQTVEFNVINGPITVDDPDTFDIAIKWDFVDLETLELQSATPVFRFERTGSSWVWGDHHIRWHRPTAQYHPELLVP